MRLGVACGKCEWRGGEGNRIWIGRVERRMKFTRSKSLLKQRIKGTHFTKWRESDGGTAATDENGESETILRVSDSAICCGLQLRAPSSFAGRSRSFTSEFGLNQACVGPWRRERLAG